MTTLSIVSPAHNEAANLPSFYHRIKSVMDEAGMEWNLVVVDDQSTDDTFEVLTRLAAEDARITAVRLARNAGSHKAILCGLEYAEGDCVTIMASDLEDPPEQIPMLVEKWRAGARVVWAARQDRHNVGFVYRMLARLYYVFSRRVIGLKNLPETGADFLLLDQATAQIVRQYRDKSLSLFALIAWLDQPSAVVTYHKETRRHGHSSWTLGSRVKLVIDTLVSFSYLPIRIMTMIGFITSMAGFGFALNVLWNAFYGTPPLGWTTLVIVVLFIGGLQMIMLGFLGEYLWRTFDEVRQRPLFMVETVIGGDRNRDGRMAPKAPG